MQQTSRDEHNWLRRRVKIAMHIEGVGTTPLGVFVPSAPSENWDDKNLTLDVELLDLCSVLDADSFAHTYSVAKDANVIAAVRDLILSSGEKAGSITASDATLSSAMTWEAGTSKLQIVNDLLDAANYFSLQVDGNGHFRVEKHRLPSERPVAYEFFDNDESIYVSDFTYEKDVFSVPNKVVLVTQGDGTEEPLTSIATNTNPNSPYSYQSRGRWIVDVQKGVEATSQDVLDEKAQRRLSDLTSPTGTITIDHAPLPWLGVSDVVRFRRTEADINVRAVVTSMALELDPLALSRTQLQEVAEL